LVAPLISKKLPIKLPRFYEECLKHFAEFSTATEVTDQETDRNKLAKTAIWNNKYICVDGKTAFHPTLFDKGIVVLADLISNENELIFKQNLNNSGLPPLEVFYLMRVIDALPAQWRNSLMSFEPRHKKDFVLNDLIQLRFSKQDVPLSKAVSKTIYVEVRRKFEAPTAQARFTDQFFNSPLDWKAIYKLPFKDPRISV